MIIIPLFPSIVIALLLISGGIVTLIGSLGLLRFDNFVGRIHATAMGNTLGSILILAASIVMSWYLDDRVFFHEIVMILFLFLTSPISSMLLMRSYILREERMKNRS